MTKEKFLQDVLTVLDFIGVFCHNKHEECLKSKESLDILYKNEKVGQCEFELCPSCRSIFLYSYARLQECPHEIKPRCRNCSNPCYEKREWKTLAKIMRYSGIKKGILKVKKIFR